MRRQSSRSVLGLLVLAVAAGGCTAVQGAVQNLPTGGVGGAMAGAALPSSGGTTLNAAQAVRKGETVEGVVQEGGPRFYRLELNRGESVTATFYGRMVVPSSYSGPSQLPVIAFLDANGGVLKREMTLIKETVGKGGFDRMELPYTSSRGGTVLVRVDCEECGQRVHYRVAFQ